MASCSFTNSRRAPGRSNSTCGPRTRNGDRLSQTGRRLWHDVIAAIPAIARRKRHARLSDLDHRPRLHPVPRRLRHACDARGVFGFQPDLALRRSRDRAGEGRGALRRDSGEAAEEIAKRTDVSAFDFDLLRSETDIVGYPILPLVHQMAKQCGEAGRYVHWGATTQDIMDTAVVLQVRAGLEIIEADIAALRGILADLSEALSRYADGRPHPSAAGAAGDVRLQDRDLARDVRSPRRAPRAIEAARAGRPVRRRRRHAGLARRQGV